MLIPDLLNILFDQTNYHGLVIMESLNKRKTKYANRYSVLPYYRINDQIKAIILKSLKKRANNYKRGVLPCHKTYVIILHALEFGLIKIIKDNIQFVQIDHALLLSARHDNIVVVKYLISVGANIHSRNYCALQTSASHGNISVVKYLVSIGTNIHKDNDYALRWSAHDGHLEVVKYLVGAGANIHAHVNGALVWSAREGHLEVVKYLISVGADIHCRDDELFELSIISDNFSHLKDV